MSQLIKFTQMFYNPFLFSPQFTLCLSFTLFFFFNQMEIRRIVYDQEKIRRKNTFVSAKTIHCHGNKLVINHANVLLITNRQHRWAKSAINLIHREHSTNCSYTFSCEIAKLCVPGSAIGMKTSQCTHKNPTDVFRSKFKQ